MVLDPSIYIVEEVFNFLRDKDLLADKCSKPGYEFITSGDVGKFKDIAERFLEKKIDKVEKK
jgi:glutamate racemase